jgi:hypothetical protein
VNIVQIVCDRYHLLVKAIVAGLVATNQKNRIPQWIETVKDTIGTPSVLDAKLAHVTVT